MRPFVTLFFNDVSEMIRSWTVWIWLGVTIFGGVTSVVLSSTYSGTDTTSFILSWGLYLYVAMGSLVIISISAGATSAELLFLGNAIISRGVNPFQYVLSKLFSRFLTVVALYILVVFPASFAIMAQGSNNDMTVTGVLLALTYVGLLLGILVMIGVTFSTLIPNILVAVSMLGILWYTGLATYVATQSDEFTADAVLGSLPLLLQGSFNMVNHWPVIAYLCIPLALLPLLAIYFFSTKDL